MTNPLPNFSKSPRINALMQKHMLLVVSDNVAHASQDLMLNIVNGISVIPFLAGHCTSATRANLAELLKELDNEFAAHMMMKD